MAEEIIDDNTQQQQPTTDYVDNVYKALKSKVQGFNVSPDEFRKTITTDNNYRGNVYKALKNEFSDFNVAPDEFSGALGIKKKEPTHEALQYGQDATNLSKIVGQQNGSQSQLTSTNKDGFDINSVVGKPATGIGAPVNASESTSAKIEHPDLEAIQKQHDNALNNTAAKRLQGKGIEVNDETLASEKNAVQKDVSNGVLKLHKDDNGNISFQRDASAMQGFVRNLNRNLLNASYGIVKGINALRGGDNSNLENQQAAELQSVDKDPYGSMLHSLNVFHTDEGKRLQDINKDNGGNDVSYNNLAPTLGGLGGDITYFSPTNLAGGTVSKLGAALAMSYAKNYGAKSNEIYNELKNNGASDEDAQKKASIDALGQAIPQSAMETALFGGAMPSPKISSDLLTAIGHAAKRTGLFAGISGATQGGEELVKGMQGYDTEGWQDRVKNAVLSGTALTAVMEGLPILASLPKYARSAIKEFAINPDVKPMVDEYLSKVPNGNEIKSQLDNYEQATQPLRGIIPDEKMPSVGGRVEKINNLTKDIQDANVSKMVLPEAIHPEIDKKIEEKQAEIQNTNKEIKEALKSDNPLSIEKDDVTGEPIIKNEENNVQQPAEIEKPTNEEANINQPKTEEKIGEGEEAEPIDEITQKHIDDAKARIDLAQKNLTKAESKIAKTQSEQQSIFGSEGTQKGMFAMDGEEAKNTLAPLKEELKKAKAEHEDLKKRFEVQNNAANPDLFKEESKAPIEKSFTQNALKRSDAKTVHAEFRNVVDEVPPTDARSLALSYLAGEGKIHPDSINDVVGTTKRASLNTGAKEAKSSEVSARDYAASPKEIVEAERKGKDLSVKGIAHSLWEGLPEDLQNKITDHDIRNELENAISSHNTRLEAAKEYINSYSADAAEKRHQQQFIDQHESEIKQQEDVLNKWLQDESEMNFEDEETKLYNDLIKQHESEKNEGKNQQSSPESKTGTNKENGSNASSEKTKSITPNTENNAIPKQTTGEVGVRNPSTIRQEVGEDNRPKITSNEIKPQSEENGNVEKPIGEIEGGKRISKLGLKEEGYVKNFDSKDVQDVANHSMGRLSENASNNNVSIEQQAQNEVNRIIANKDLGEASEYDINVAAYHAMNIDEKLADAVKLGDKNEVERLNKLKDDASLALRILGNNAGRNLGLFGAVYNKVSDNGISVTKQFISKSTGIKDIPDTVEGLNNALKNNDITNAEYQNALPLVTKLEKIIAENKKYETDIKNKIVSAREDEINKAIEEAKKQWIKDNQQNTTNKPKLVLAKDRENVAKSIENIAAKIEGFMRLKGDDIQRMGSIDIQKKIADGLRLIAQKVREGKLDMPTIIKDVINKLGGENKLEYGSEIKKQLNEAGVADDLIGTFPTKESKAELLNKISGIAQNEGTKEITKYMVNSGLIKDLINHYIHEDIPSKDILSNVTDELKKVLPNVSKEDVEDAFMRSGEFAKENTKKVLTNIQEKTQEVKILTTKERKVNALQTASDYTQEKTQQGKQRIKSDYEKGLDDRIKELNDYHKETERLLKDALNDEIKEPKSRLEDAKALVEKRIQKIRDEIAAKKRDVVEKEPPLHKDVELERLEQTEKSLTELRDKYLPKEKEPFVDEKTLKQRGKNLVNEISDLNDQINSKTRKTKKPTVEDTKEIEALKQIRDAKKELLDKLVPDTEKQKADQEKLKEKLSDIQKEKDYINNEKKVFQQSIKEPNKINDDLVKAKRELSDAYSRNGLALERGNRKPILIERDYQNAKSDIENNKELTEDEKKQQLKEIEGKRNLELKNTKQGILNNLHDSVKNVLDDVKSRINDAIKNKDAKSIDELSNVKDKLENALSNVNISGEKIDDMISKVLDGISDKKDMPKDIVQSLSDIEKQTEGNNQLTSNELSAQRLKRQYENDIKSNKTKINSGITTRLEASPLDFRTSKELSVLNKQREITRGKLKSIEKEAADKNKTIWDKALDFSSKNLVSGIDTNIKVHGIGTAKFIADGIVDYIGSKVFKTHLLTSSPEATLRGIKEGFSALGKFKNKEAAEKFIDEKYKIKQSAFNELNDAEKNGNKKDIGEALKKYNKATLEHAFATLYNSINANSLDAYWQVLSHGATDYDVAQGKAVKKSISDMQTNLGKVGYAVEGWIRMHAAAKTSLSGRAEMARSFYNTLKYYQENGVPLDETTISHSEVMSSLAYENGKMTSKNALSKGLNWLKNNKIPAIRYPSKFLFAVSTIAANVAKRSVDYAVGGAEGTYRILQGAKEGMKLNEAEGKEYDSWAKKFKAGVEKMPLQERIYIQGVFNRQAIGAALMGATIMGLAGGYVKYGGTYDNAKKHKVIGSDGEPLKNGEWEFFGTRIPSLMNKIINHLPAFMGMSIAANSYEIHKLNQDEDGFKEFAEDYKATLDELGQRLPVMTLIGMLNPYKAVNTLIDRFTRVPLAKTIGDNVSDTENKENVTPVERLKTNTGFGSLNPEKPTSIEEKVNKKLKTLQHKLNKNNK